jgi:hypothetical protein
LYSCSCVMTIVLPLSACVIVNFCSAILFFMPFRVFHSCFALSCLGCFSYRVT